MNKHLPTLALGTDPVVTPALDHLYSKAVIDLTNEISRYLATYFLFH